MYYCIWGRINRVFTKFKFKSVLNVIHENIYLYLFKKNFWYSNSTYLHCSACKIIENVELTIVAHLPISIGFDHSPSPGERDVVAKLLMSFNYHSLQDLIAHTIMPEAVFLLSDYFCFSVFPYFSLFYMYRNYCLRDAQVDIEGRADKSAKKILQLDSAHSYFRSFIDWSFLHWLMMYWNG